MGNGDDRDSSALDREASALIYERLRDARLSDSGGNMRGLLTDTLKKLTINGRGVSGSGLSFSIGNTGLGVDVAGGVTGAQSPAASEPLPLLPIPSVTIAPPAIPPPLSINLEQPAPAPTPEINVSEIAQVPVSAPPFDRGEQFLATNSTELVTGAVNGVPATLNVFALGTWQEI